MVQTFSYNVEVSGWNYHQTVHSPDIESSVAKWLIKLEDLQNEVYSFSKNQVDNIRNQFLNGQLKKHLDKEPYFLSYRVDDSIQVVKINKVQKEIPDFVAKLTYLLTEDGGRKGYAASGYRPHVKFDGRTEKTSGEQLFVDKDKVFPGENVTAEIRMLNPNIFQKFLFPGQHFEFAEGSKIVGHGEIIEILNPVLSKDDY